MTESKKSETEIAKISRNTVARTQKTIAELENAQRKRKTPFTPHEIKDYESFITTGAKQAKKVQKLLEES